MRLRETVLGLVGGLSLAGSAVAHHSAAMFDSTRTVTLKGVVKEFQWTNPHTWLRITVLAADGRTSDWSIEMTSPNLLSRAGWRPGTIKAGDKITLVGIPLRDGGPGAQFRSAIMEDGRVLTNASASGASRAIQP